MSGGVFYPEPPGISLTWSSSTQSIRSTTFMAMYGLCLMFMQYITRSH